MKQRSETNFKQITVVREYEIIITEFIPTNVNPLYGLTNGLINHI